MKFDIKCEEGRQAKETMEQYMYTYLNQRYGLKNLIIEWAASIIAGIKQFSKEDHEVALFGKILRNECDEEFRFIQHTVKETVYALLKAVLKERYSSKSEDYLLKLQEQITADSIEKWQWKKIIEKMYDEEDFKQL
jgi:isochorismate synthase EntC